ncbi:D-alanyl-D-alanine carboxypeptidase family protein [Secundilactobacillus silagei]|uniref:D-alanyl-D-alanine carboxypeptidase family protein n=1 Tax=Secundilactobacillus silagei TaxID=1293415 RepID=UPI002092F94B|nr:D-alanyl-D-alanine carboxypeptidase family protein [Secundilactobacillus silagei]
MSDYTKVKSAYVMDAKSGQTLYQNHADRQLPIASLSKMMTLYLTTQAIKHHQLHWNDKVPVDHQLVKMSKSYSLGSFKIKHSDQYTVKDLYQAALIASSNSAAIALGKAVTGGDNAKFIAMMNHQAKVWGIDAHFVSSSGLDNTDLKSYGYRLDGTPAKAQNMVSAKAISIVAQHLIKAFPQITKWSTKPNAKLNGQTLVNANSMLKPGFYYRASNHLTGLKTGYTETAGLCLTVTYWRHGRELIATILGSKSTFSAMNGLITHLDKTVKSKSMTETPQKYRIHGHQVTADPAEAHTQVWYRIGQDPKKIKITNRLTATELPVKKGQQLTTTTFNNTGLPTATTQTGTAAKTVRKPVAKQGNTSGTNWFSRLFAGIGKTFSQVFLNFCIKSRLT